MKEFIGNGVFANTYIDEQILKKWKIFVEILKWNFFIFLPNLMYTAYFDPETLVYESTKYIFL